MKRLLYRLLIIAIVSLLAGIACSFSVPEILKAPQIAQVTYHVGIDASYPPFEYIDAESNQIVGFDIDLMNTIAERAGFKVEYENLAWGDLVDSMDNCGRDIYISAMPVLQVSEGENACYAVYRVSLYGNEFLYSYCQWEENPISFSQAYFHSGAVVLVRADNTDILSYEDLDGKMIIAQIGTVSHELIYDMWGMSIDVLLFEEMDWIIQALIDEKADAAITDLVTALNYMRENQGLLKIAGEPLTDTPFVIAVCDTSSDQLLLNKINTALDELLTDGTIDDLQEKWLNIP